MTTYLKHRGGGLSKFDDKIKVRKYQVQTGDWTNYEFLVVIQPNGYPYEKEVLVQSPYQGMIDDGSVYTAMAIRGMLSQIGKTPDDLRAIGAAGMLAVGRVYDAEGNCEYVDEGSL